MVTSSLCNSSVCYIRSTRKNCLTPNEDEKSIKEETLLIIIFLTPSFYFPQWKFFTLWRKSSDWFKIISNTWSVQFKGSYSPTNLITIIVFSLWKVHPPSTIQLPRMARRGGWCCQAPAELRVKLYGSLRLWFLGIPFKNSE